MRLRILLVVLLLTVVGAGWGLYSTRAHILYALKQQWSHPTPVVTVIHSAQSTTTDTSPAPTTPDDISVLPSVYEHQEYGGLIPRILLTNAQHQVASIILTEKPKAPTASTPISTTTSTASPQDALVNIFCTLKTKQSIRATSGSGVFISDSGVILTNAHVAQFLLINGGVTGVTASCVVRSGSPAVPKYYADLLYISPLWIKDNAALLQTEHPSGTGERDYALLYVTKTVDGAPLPTIFPALPIDVTPLETHAKNQVVLAGGFPAEIIRTEGPAALLTPIVATTTITELFTYTRNNIDLVGIAPSAVGEQGSSGGPIIALNNTIIGLISTKGNEAKDGAKSLRAITLPYIDRTIRDEVHVGLLDTIGSKLSERAQIFRTTVEPLLRNMVLDNIH